MRTAKSSLCLCDAKEMTECSTNNDFFDCAIFAQRMKVVLTLNEKKVITSYPNLFVTTIFLE